MTVANETDFMMSIKIEPTDVQSLVADCKVVKLVTMP